MRFELLNILKGAKTLVHRRSRRGLQKLSWLPKNLIPTTQSSSSSCWPGEVDIATFHTTSVWQRWRVVNVGIGIIVVAFVLKAEGLQKSVTRRERSCRSLKNNHPWEAPTTVPPLTISSGMVLSVHVTNLSVAASNKWMSPTMPPSLGESFSTMPSGKHGLVDDDENKRMVLCNCHSREISK